MKKLLIVQAPCTFTPRLDYNSACGKSYEHLNYTLSQFDKVHNEFHVIFLVKDASATNPYDWEFEVIGDNPKW